MREVHSSLCKLNGTNVRIKNKISNTRRGTCTHDVCNSVRSNETYMHIDFWKLTRSIMKLEGEHVQIRENAIMCCCLSGAAWRGTATP